MTQFLQQHYDLRFRDYEHHNRFTKAREQRRYPRPKRWEYSADEGYACHPTGQFFIASDRDFNKESWRLHGARWSNCALEETSFDWKLARAHQALAEDASIPRREVQEAIEDSRRILDLDDDWDEQGSVGYTSEAWRAAVDFLIAIDSEVDALGKQMMVPQILPGPAGSIDLHWKTASFELLMKVPPTDALVTFYGDDYGRNQFEGSVGIDDATYAAIVLLKFS